jgi:fused signal recognition particle receptor
MTFNWFNRNANPNPASEQPAEAVDPTEADNSATSTPESAEQPSSEQLLDFAKRAYENLKQQKADGNTEADNSESQPQLDDAPAAEIESTPPAPSESSVSEPTPEPTASEPTQIYAPPTDDSALPFWARAEADREVRLARLRETSVNAPPSIPSSPFPSASPFPEVVAPSLSVEELYPTLAEAVPPAGSAPPGIAQSSIAQSAIEPVEPVILDGDFLWSTEVLAMQGRRPEDITIEEITWLKQLRQGLDRTRRNLINNLRAIVGQGPLNEEGVMEIEALLLQADVGVQATDRIIAALQKRLKEEVLPPEQAIAYLKQVLRELLEEPLQGQHRVAFVPEKDQLNIWLITGVNGAGKTTTIGKLAHIASKSGYKCLIAAADTFRAAAVEQVKVWGQRSEVEVIANPGKNTDPAAVVFDGIAAAQSRGSELLLVDTAGRLQNKKNLMDELSKIRRIIDNKATGAKVESLLVLDATLGQNGLQQAKVFAEAAQLSGVVLTKLDGTAKGGIAIAVVQQLGLPIRFIGAGEGIEDLRPFSSYEFVEALISG